MDEIVLKPIGVIHTPFQTQDGTPIQPNGAEGVEGWIEIDPDFQDGLKDLDGFSHVYLLYHFDRVKGFDLVTVPYMDTVPHGVFATRSPKRPNPIGISIVKIKSVDENVIHVENVDMLDGTPLIDIKPYVPSMDDKLTEKNGWLTDKNQKSKSTRADDRFK